MALFKFFLTGTAEAPVIELDEPDLDALHQLMTRSKFIQGRMIEIAGAAMNTDVLIPVNRIQFVAVADD